MPEPQHFADGSKKGNTGTATYEIGVHAKNGRTLRSYVLEARRVGGGALVGGMQDGFRGKAAVNPAGISSMEASGGSGRESNHTSSQPRSGSKSGDIRFEHRH